MAASVPPPAAARQRTVCRLTYKRALANISLRSPASPPAGIGRGFWAELLPGVPNVTPLKILAGAVVLACAVPLAMHRHGHDCAGAHLLAWTGLSAPGGKDQAAPSGTWVLQGAEM